VERQREEGRAAARERWLVGAKAAAEDAASAAAATVTVITTAFAANLASSPSATDLTAAVNAGDADAAAAAAAASAVAVACGTPMMAPLRLGDAALYQSRITLLAGPHKKCSIHHRVYVKANPSGFRDPSNILGGFAAGRGASRIGESL